MPWMSYSSWRVSYKTHAMGRKAKWEFKTWGEWLHWVYANLNMCNAAFKLGKQRLDQQCFMIRSKAFKAYKDGRWAVHSLYENNNWKMDWGKDYCWYCGRSIDECGKLTAEHIFPRAKGGDDSFDNIAYACRSCNSSKGDKDLVEWMLSQGIAPGFPLVCIYMKLVYKYSMEHNLMGCPLETVLSMDLPFSPTSLKQIETLAKEHYISQQNLSE